MAFSGNEPWRGLGVSVSDDMTPIEMLKKANLDWHVHKVPIGRMIPEDFSDFEHGKTTKFRISVIDRQWSLVRTTDGTHFTIVGDTYKVRQNHEAIEAFVKFVKSAGMTMMALGSIREQKHIWALAKTGYSFDLGEDDVVESCVLMSSPHVLGQGMTIKHLDMRMIGVNTIVQQLRDDGKRVSIESLDETRAALTRGVAVSMSENFSEKARFLSSKRAQRDDVKEFIYRLVDTKSIKEHTKIEDAGRPAKKIYEVLDTQPGRSIRSVNGTWWGAFNAVLYTVDHVLSKDRDIALSNSWFGNRAALKIKALSRAMEYANRSPQI